MSLIWKQIKLTSKIVLDNNIYQRVDKYEYLFEA